MFRYSVKSMEFNLWYFCNFNINSSILFKNKSLLCDPNPNSPANNEAAKFYLENKKEY